MALYVPLPATCLVTKQLTAKTYWKPKVLFFALHEGDVCPGNQEKVPYFCESANSRRKVQYNRRVVTFELVMFLVLNAS